MAAGLVGGRTGGHTGGRTYLGLDARLQHSELLGGCFDLIGCAEELLLGDDGRVVRVHPVSACARTHT